MDRHDLELAFFRRLTALALAGATTLRPDEVFDASTVSQTQLIRRGNVGALEAQTRGFGDGVYTRVDGIYFVDLYVYRTSSSGEGPLKRLNTVLGHHLDQFWPPAARGLSLTENQTTAHIVRRPQMRTLPRAGAYLRGMVEVEFYVEVLAGE